VPFLKIKNGTKGRGIEINLRKPALYVKKNLDLNPGRHVPPERATQACSERIPLANIPDPDYIGIRALWATP
jgi:hypothetical protein